ncbi:MAG: FAD-dependent oxidoreductase [Armatimonadetes bacterium]|nr:FAD-dependent oxidoreductase [Armatimonadota bacterium]
MDEIKILLTGFWSLLVGLRVTFKNFLKPPVTLQYPWEKWTLPQRSRGLIKIKGFFDKDTISKKSFYFKKEQNPPCNFTCPANTDARGYINAIAQGDYKKGVRILNDTYPFSGSLGRVCPAPCEGACNREIAHNQSITIRQLKRFLADYNRNLPKDEKVPLALETLPKKDKKIAVIGAGPSGLSCAADLARLGYKVIVYESLETAGGYLATGIPVYRLPKDILKEEIEEILNLGVEIKFGKTIGKDLYFEDLWKEGYGAIFIGVGATLAMKLGISGEDLEGVVPGEDFLKKINLNKTVNLGDKIVVIGGGNTAIDCARVSRRLGKEVTILYRRTLAEMPAVYHEIHEALEEGVKIELLVAPTKILGENGKVAGVECCRMTLGEKDQSGRRRPIMCPGNEIIFSAQTIFSAISRTPDLSFLPNEIKLNKNCTIKVDFKTGQTTARGIFAGGDAVLGPSTVIEAIACGKRAALGIDAYLKNN